MLSRASALVRCALLPAFLAALVSTALPGTARAQPTPHHPGLWTTAAPWPGRVVFDTSVQAVHMALVRGDTLFGRPYAQVLAWGNWSPSAPTGGGLWGWRATTDTSASAATNLTRLDVGTPPYDLFCAGHAALKSGELHVVSGTERGKTGAKQSARFSPLSRGWTSSPMTGRRWYANATLLADEAGRLLATAGNAGHHMVVFGGQSKNESDPEVLVNDVKRYRITNAGERDTPLTDDGFGSDWPAPRQFHTLTDKATLEGQAGGPYYLFGGKDGSGATRSDVWQLRLHDNDFEESYVWREVLPASGSPLPPSRWRHAAVVVPSSTDTLSTMYVHGGERVIGTTTTPLDDFWKLEWRTSPAPHWEWFEITDTTGNVPPGPRSGHSMIWDRDSSRAILYGGRVNGALDDPDVYVLTLPGGVPTWWRAPLASGTRPPARTRHAMDMNPRPNQLSTGIVFGGETTFGLSDTLWEFTLSGPAASPSVTWARRDPGGSPAPAGRTDATLVGYAEHPTSYLLLGGELAGGAWDSTAWEFRFAVEGNRWHPLAPPAPALRGHRAIMEDRLLTPLQPERYNPDSNTWMPYGQLKKRQSYHLMFSASDGRLYSPGPTRFSGIMTDSTWRFDLADGSWELYAINNTTPMPGTIGGVLYRPDLIMKCGGLGHFEQTGATKSLQTGLPLSPAPTWRSSVNPLQLPRSDHILTMLPTGEVLASGGQGLADDDDNVSDDALPRRRPEIWDPDYTQGGAVGYWYGADPNAAIQLDTSDVTRGHHSSAVLLPDGRLLSGGGWDYHLDPVKRSVDQYSPPYLFEPDGDPVFRPRLYGAQDHIPYGQTFKVACPDSVLAACLIRPGASTHSFTQDHRYVPLSFSQPLGSHQVTVAALTKELAPPGNYLLFVLRNDQGRKVPSIARWVNVGISLPAYATWDTLPPATIDNLAITDVTPTSHTLQWTAPSDSGDGTSFKATRYELCYRIGGSMPTLEDFFAHGESVVGLPAPGTSGTTQTFTLNGTNENYTYFFRIISRDGAGSDRNWSGLSNEVQTPSGGGGCPFVDTRTARGWEVENSILGRSLTGALALDSYRLRHLPEVVSGRVRLRVRENEQERTTLDQVRLIAVDHAPGVRAWPMGEEVVLGARVAAERVTTSAGADVTTLVKGTGEGYSGGPGDTLLVEFAAGALAVVGEEGATQSHDPFHIDDGGKCPPDCGSPLRSPADPLTATAIDAQVLGNSGIQLQRPDGLGGWRTVVTRYPREHADQAVLDGLGHGPMRLVFVGRHRVRFVGRIEHAGGEAAVQRLPLLSARHSRLGDVAAALDTTGVRTSELAPGDTLSLEFGWTPLPEGQVRELFFLSHGVYTAILPSALSQVLPERFAIHKPRPNPFAGSTTLRFDLPLGRHVRLEVLDAQGRRVRTLANHALPAGSHAIEWDGRSEAGSSLGAGIYFYRFEAGEFRAKGRIARVP